MGERWRRTLPPGLYDETVTRALSDALSADDVAGSEVEPLDSHRVPLALTRVIAPRLLRALEAIRGEAADADRVALANRILGLLGASPDSGCDDGDLIAPPPQQLLAVLEAVAPPARPRAPGRPSIPLASSDLLVNGPHDLSLGPELRRELESADRIDLLCSLLKWSGIRVLEAELKAFAERRGGAALRVLTTAYMHATERRALDWLRDLGAQVRVSYDTTQTRLHAKAWLLHRRSGNSTAFVGSSNLSAAAMLAGTEWNVRLSQIDNAGILDKFTATFEQYWLDPAFRAFAPEEFDTAVQQSQRVELAPYLLLDVEPRAHQKAILEDLAAERAKGHTRNLVVAATGTGKTIVAALDYRALRSTLPGDRLLFVAHRREILEQTLATFRVALRDGAFGELLVDGARPDGWRHVFASIQSLHANQLEGVPPDAFDVLIVDEFHHAAASTYDRLLSHLKPRVLLGLTATPERADGQSILGWFDGRVASEMRLWEALDQGLLSPFQYFGIGSAPDVSSVRWSGRYYDVKALSNVYTADHLFAKRVVQEVARTVTNPRRMRALGFCVDVAHAQFMARVFVEAGLPAVAVSAQTSKSDRASSLAALRAGDVVCVFSVDLFNEGVDLPDVDTVLFLRPTESATIFLQQLGRGLRRSRDKECLTVLDFIGDASRRFRFDRRYRAIVGGTRRGIESAVEHGFPSLPSGCSIHLDKQAQRAVLENLRAQIGIGVRGLVEDLRAVGATFGPDVELATFLQETGADLEDVYASGRCWSSLRRLAGLAACPQGPHGEQLERALGRMLHIDDATRLQRFGAIVSSPVAPRGDDTDPLQRMLFALLGFVRRPYSELQEAWNALWMHDHLRDELRQLLAILEDRSRRVTYPLGPSFPGVPLEVHARYTLDEISDIAGLEERTVARKMTEAHGGTLVRNLFERAWPVEDTDPYTRKDSPTRTAPPDDLSSSRAPRRSNGPTVARGKIVAGRYELKELLGRGGFGVAWRAIDHHLPSKPTRVLKFAHTPELGESLWTEMEKAYELNHPNICKPGEAHRDQSLGPFLVYPYAGRSLADRMSTLGPRRDLAQTIALEVGKALDHAHGENVIHHDVSPGNILIGDDGRVRLTDFGVAKSVMARATTGGGRTRVATSTSLAFHRGYVAPEVSATGEAKPASDQYSLAKVVCSILEQRLFEGPYAFKPFSKLSRSQNAAIERALEMRPRDRFPSCTDFAEALSSA